MKRPLSGLPAWLVQRVSAVLMLGFILFVLAHFLLDPPHSYAAWRSWVTHPGVALATILFVAAMLAHAWVGLRDVTLDYVAPLVARLVVLSLIALSLLAVAAWTIRIMFVVHA